MEEMMVVTPEHNLGEGNNTPTGGIPTTANLSFKEEDFAKDMETLKAQMTPAPTKPEVAVAPPVEAPAPAQEQKPETPVTTQDKPSVEVPEKFKTPDGKIDETKLAKSAANVEETLKKYLEKEKELSRKINEIKAKENPYLSATPAPVQPDVPVDPNIGFEQQIEQDIQKEGVGKVLKKLFNASMEAALEKARQEITPIKENLVQAQTKSQVEAIGKADPWVYTPEGFETLTTILNDKPWLMQSENPYKEAYIYYQGARTTSQRVEPQVSIPTPTAKPTAPIPSGQAAAPSHQAQTVRLDDPKAISEHLKKMTTKQQSDFFHKMGFPAFE